MSAVLSMCRCVFFYHFSASTCLSLRSHRKLLSVSFWLLSSLEVHNASGFVLLHDFVFLHRVNFVLSHPPSHISPSCPISPGCSKGPDGCRSDRDHHAAGVETPTCQTGLLQTSLCISWRPQRWGHGAGQLWVSHPEEPNTWHAVHHQYHCWEGSQDQCTRLNLRPHRSVLWTYVYLQ